MLLSSAPALADGIVTIIDKGPGGVIARIDGAFGCRVESRTGNADMEISDRCTFGATDGTHTLVLDFDSGPSQTQTITVTRSGYTVTVP